MSGNDDETSRGCPQFAHYRCPTAGVRIARGISVLLSLVCTVMIRSLQALERAAPKYEGCICIIVPEVHPKLQTPAWLDSNAVVRA